MFTYVQKIFARMKVPCAYKKSEAQALHFSLLRNGVVILLLLSAVSFPLYASWLTLTVGVGGHRVIYNGTARPVTLSVTYVEDVKMVPLRPIAELLGAHVYFNSRMQTIVLFTYYGELHNILVDTSPYNGSAMLIDDMAFVPACDIAHLLDANVYVDENGRTIHIYKHVNDEYPTSVNNTLDAYLPENVSMTTSARVPGLVGAQISAVISPISRIFGAMGQAASQRGHSDDYTTAPAFSAFSDVTHYLALDNRYLGTHPQPSIASAGIYSSFVISNSTLWSWGWNSHGQLGDGTTINRTHPTKIMHDVTYVTTSTTAMHSFAITECGTLWGWGFNAAGQLGDGTTIDRHAPVAIMDNVIAVAAGATFSMALRYDGTLWTWGNGANGQLGCGSVETRLYPMQVMTGVSDINAGMAHAFALKYDGTLWGWGNNYMGQLGTGTTDTYLTPVQVKENVSTVSTGITHTLAVTHCNTLWAWGYNDIGQLGDGTTQSSHVPIAILGDVILADASGTGGEMVSFSLALRTDGTLWAWGNGAAGALGNGTYVDSALPQQVYGLYDVVAISAGVTALAITADGIIWSWGHNGGFSYGEFKFDGGAVGDGSLIDRNLPVRVL